MRPGTALQLACELVPYALVGITVLTAAFGAPMFATLSALVLVAQLANAGAGECDIATWLLGDAPR